MHTTLIAMRLGDRLGVDGSMGSQTYYACLLSHAGCTTDAHVAAEIFGDSLTTHFIPSCTRRGARRFRASARAAAAGSGGPGVGTAGAPPAHDKQVARSLAISAKTADRHVQNAYRKIGASSRAAATLFAWSTALSREENSRWRSRPLASNVFPDRQPGQAPQPRRYGMTSETIYDVAEAIAATFERRRGEVEEVLTPVREWLLRELAPREGDIVLELAAGIGDTGFDAAALVGARGRLISSDFSPAMLEAARRRGAERGVQNVEYRVIDAERIELDDDSVDGVLCRHGYMLMTDPAAALAETRRVLRPGGRLALAVWGAPERNPFVTIVALSLMQRGHLPPPEPPPAPGPFSMASAERTTQLLRGAAFADVRTEEVMIRFAVPNVDEYLAFIADTAGPIALALRRLSDADRAQVRAEVEDSLGRFSAGKDYELPGVALCATAR